jgi:hypothetical protein
MVRPLPSNIIAIRQKIAAARNHAVKRGVKFDPDFLTVEWCLKQTEQRPYCPICGRRLVWDISGCGTASLDRIDNNEGYVVGNVDVICWSCNFTKRRIPVGWIINAGRYYDRRKPPVGPVYLPPPWKA